MVIHFKSVFLISPLRITTPASIVQLLLLSFLSGQHQSYVDLFNNSLSVLQGKVPSYLYARPFAFVASQTSFPTEGSGYQEL